MRRFVGDMSPYTVVIIYVTLSVTMQVICLYIDLVKAQKVASRDDVRYWKSKGKVRNNKATDTVIPTGMRSSVEILHKGYDVFGLHSEEDTEFIFDSVIPTGMRLSVEILDKGYDIFVFVLHSEEDTEFIFDPVMPLLKNHGVYMATEDFFPPGKQKLECLHETLHSCQSALVVLTPDFLNEKWKSYQLDLFALRATEEKKFEVLFVLRQELETLGELPKNIQMFLKTSPIFKEYKQGWEQKLVCELKSKPKRSVSAALKCGAFSCFCSCFMKRSIGKSRKRVKKPETDIEHHEHEIWCISWHETSHHPPILTWHVAILSFWKYLHEIKSYTNNSLPVYHNSVDLFPNKWSLIL